MVLMPGFHRVAAICFIFSTVSGVHPAPPMGDVTAAYMRSLGFSGLYTEVHATGTVLGGRPTETLHLLFEDGPGGIIGLTTPQRDALILEIVRHETNQEPARAREIVGMLYMRTADLEDWTAVAEVIERAVREDIVTDAPARSILLLTDLAHRILATLEAPSPARAGYEGAALALAAGVAALADEPEFDARLSATVLAEQLRSIMRLSRDAPTVRALSKATQRLLAVERTLPADSGAN